MSDIQLENIRETLLREREERRVVEKKYELQTAEFNAIFQNLADAFLMMNLSGRVLKMNNPAKEILGYDLEVEKFNLMQLVNASEVEKVTEAFKKLIIDGILTNFKLLIITKYGENKYVSVNASIIYDDNDNPIAAQGIVRDITEAKKLEVQKDNLLEKLKKTNEDLQDYIHMVSHDLKSPLRNINALILWLNEDYRNKFDETGIKNLNLIQSNVEKMEKMISGILEYSSLDSEKVEMYDVDINNLLNEVFSTLIIHEHISISINNELPIIKGDNFRLHQLFRNLLNNAIANIDKTEGIIEISSIEEISHWKFCIKDNGKGIEKGYLKKIFEVFQKLDNKNNSTGIGLSIVKKIVKIYEGGVYAESDPGKGTEIHFTLKKF
jgi:PAS domain S-box-containing protein